MYPAFNTFLAAVRTAGLTDLLTSGRQRLMFAQPIKTFSSCRKDELDAR